MDAAELRRSLPAKRMGSGALIRDTDGRVLIVEPTYKATWEVPGGVVEADESPLAACDREIREELGVSLTIGRLLCLEYQPPETDRTESLMFVYDGGVLDPSAITLAADELASFAFVQPSELVERLTPRLSRRLLAALQALSEERLVELG